MDPVPAAIVTVTAPTGIVVAFWAKAGEADAARAKTARREEIVFMAGAKLARKLEAAQEKFLAPGRPGGGIRGIFTAPDFHRKLIISNLRIIVSQNGNIPAAFSAQICTVALGGRGEKKS